MSCCGRSFPASAPFSCCTMCGRAARGDFQPNHHLEVTPDFLRAMLSHLKSREIDIVTMDEVASAAVEPQFRAPLRLLHLRRRLSRQPRPRAAGDARICRALHRLRRQRFRRRHRTAVVAALEMAIAKAVFDRGHDRRHAVRLDAATASAKQAAFDRLHDWLRTPAASTICSARWQRSARAMASTRRRSAATSACPGTS